MMERKLGEQKRMEHNGRRKKKRWFTLVLKTLEGATKQVASPTTGGGKNCHKPTCNNCWERMLHNSVKKQKKPSKEKNKMLR